MVWVWLANFHICQVSKLLSIAEDCLALLSIAEHFWQLLTIAEHCWALIGVTWISLEFLEYLEVPRISSEFLRIPFRVPYAFLIVFWPLMSWVFRGVLLKFHGWLLHLAKKKEFILSQVAKDKLLHLILRIVWIAANALMTIFAMNANIGQFILVIQQKDQW